MKMLSKKKFFSEKKSKAITRYIFDIILIFDKYKKKLLKFFVPYNNYNNFIENSGQMLNFHLICVK